MNDQVEYTEDEAVYVCVFCDMDCDSTGCDNCGEYKGVMPMAEYIKYTATWLDK